MPDDSKISKAQQRAVHEYVKRNYDRIELTVKPKGKKDQIKYHADTLGETLNAFINRAINEAMERDTGSPITPPASALLPPETLEAIQRGAAATGETPPQFISRAVKEQVRRDEVSLRMGLKPITGNSSNHT